MPSIVVRSFAIALGFLVTVTNACDFVFDDGLEVPEYPPIAPSGGCSGVYPGRFVVPLKGLPVNAVIQVPDSYRPQQSMPLIFLLHGAAGPGQAPHQAQAMLDVWASVLSEHGLIAVALIATGGQGGWIPPNTQTMMEVAATQFADDYNVDLARQYGWGFSAGGHVLHALALDQVLPFAGYAVTAGALDAYAGAGAPAAAANMVPVFLSVGQFDNLYSFVQTDYQRFINAGWIGDTSVTLYSFPGGHTIGAEVPAQAWRFLRDHTK